jgi:hypothetical protein
VSQFKEKPVSDGPKTVICSVCNQSVLKARTVSIGTSRVCKHHPEANQGAVVHQKKMEKDAASREKKPKRLAFEPGEDPLQPKCACCRKPGLHQQNWFMTILLLGQKYELTYGKPLNPFDAEEGKKAYSELIGKVCLFYQEYKSGMKLWHGEFHKLGRILGFVLLCADCLKLNGSSVEEKLPKVDFDTLAALVPLSEAVVKPAIRKMAKADLETKN